MSEIQTYSEGGRGKKQCKACGKYVGARNAVCACGHQFTPKSEAKPAKPESAKPEVAEREGTTETSRRSRHFVVAINTPRGSCPHKLTGTTPEEVREWGDKVQRAYANENRHLSTNGLIYFARQFYDIHSEDYKLVRQHLVDIYGTDHAQMHDD